MQAIHRARRLRVRPDELAGQGVDDQERQDEEQRADVFPGEEDVAVRQDELRHSGPAGVKAGDQ